MNPSKELWESSMRGLLSINKVEQLKLLFEIIFSNDIPPALLNMTKEEVISAYRDNEDVRTAIIKHVVFYTSSSSR